MIFPWMDDFLELKPQEVYKEMNLIDEISENNVNLNVNVYIN